MKLNLDQLNQSWPAIAFLANSSLSDLKTSYQISRLYKEVRTHLDPATKELVKLRTKHGLVNGEAQDVESLNEYNEEARAFLTNTEVELEWSRKIPLSKLEGINIPPILLMAIDWLIDECPEDTTSSLQ